MKLFSIIFVGVIFCNLIAIKEAALNASEYANLLIIKPEIYTYKPFVSIANEVLPSLTAYSEFWTNYEAPREIQKNYPYYLSGYDHDHNPIWIQESGKWNVRKALEAGGETFKHFDRHVLQSIYRFGQSINESHTPEYPVSSIIFIGDFEGLTLDQVTVGSVSYMLNMARRYFAIIQEHLALGIIVNTNAVAQTLLNLLRPVLGRVFERMEIYGTNKAKFIPHILKHCPKDQIPVWYGGTKDFQPIKIYG